MRRCTFEGDQERPCPVVEDIADTVRDPCSPDSYGKGCAAICGQWAVARSTNLETGLTPLEESFGQITGQFSLKVIPEGVAPEQIRESIKGLSFPLREGRPTHDEDRVFVHHMDLYLTLMNSEKLPAANWYMQYAKEGEIDWWGFKKDEGREADTPRPRLSVAHYDQSFVMGASTFHNCWLPPLLIVNEILTGRRELPNRKPNNETS